MIPRRPFYFLRHGETDWNREGRYQGAADVPLNASGIAQAEAAAGRLGAVRIDRIVSSPLIRALKTAAIIADARKVPIFVERGLVERTFGSFDGQVIREVKARHGLPPDGPTRSILPSDADRWEEIFERVPPVVGRWLAAHPGETLLFVAHSGVFDALHNNLIGPRTGPESMHATPYLVAPGTAWTLVPV